MNVHTALAIIAIAAVCCAQTTDRIQSPIIGLSGDDTRHGIVVLHASFAAAHEVEVTRYHVNTLIQTRFARTVVESELRNNAVATKQITVPFAIPSNAMLVNFEIVSDGRIHQARPVLKNSLQVDSVSSGSTIVARDAESFDVDLQLAPGATVIIRLEYDELLNRHLGVYKNVQQIWPGKVVSDLKISVTIKEASSISSPTNYTFTSETAAGGVTTVSGINVVKVQNARDVSLTLQPSEAEQQLIAKQLGINADSGLAGQFNVEYEVERYPTAGDIVVRDGYFAHFFAPTNLTSLPKYALFLLDVSGSMGGRKITQLQDAMTTILGELGPNDFFTVIEFSSGNKMWQLGGVPSIGTTCTVYSSQYVPEAQKQAASMTANGGTELLGGMQQALSCAADGPVGLEPILLVLTDGQPNEPVQTIIDDSTTRNRKSNNDLLASVFTIALGSDANLDFLEKLALKNGGKARQVYEASDASLQLHDFYKAIASPLLKNVSVSFNYQQAEQVSLTQTSFRTYFWGSELVVAGRLLPGQQELSGAVSAIGAGGQIISYDIQVTSQPSWQPQTLNGEPNSKRLWAYLRTSQLLDQALTEGEGSAAALEATGLALTNSFVTKYTCLALDIVNPYTASTASDPPTPTPGYPSPSTLTSGTPAPKPTERPGPPPSGPTGRPGPPSPGPTGRPEPPSPAPTRHPGPPSPGPTGRPEPPSPTGRPGPPSPTGSPSGRGSQNSVNIGSLTIGNLSVSGPLIQFNLR